MAFGRPEGAQSGPSLTVRLILAGLAVAVAAWLMWTGVRVHMGRACILQDTPYLPLCDDPAGKPDPERRQQLRDRLASNPAEADSWIRLTHIESGKYERPLLRAVSALAPNDPNVLLWRAGDLLARNQGPQAVDLLVQLVAYRKRGEAVEALARILASGQGTALLRPHLATGDRWLPQVLARLIALKLPLSPALPLMGEASSSGTVQRQTIQTFIRALREAGLWADAYSLWLAQQRGPTPLLHNGRFDQAFEQDGFDWEVTPVLPSKAGAIVSQRPSGNRGQVLDIEFTGRPLATPLIRQYIFAPPGKYQLRGQYMGSRLRLEEGLAWAARCTNGDSAVPAGRSEGLNDTAGAWQAFQFAITVPANCGLVFSLQLETLAPSAASGGAKGRAAFDSLELVRQGV